MNYYGGRGPQPEFEATIKDALDKFGRGSRILWVIPAIALIAWLASGIYIVQPGEEGVVLTFGKHTQTTGPGMNYRIPWPVQQVSIVDVESIRRTEIGFRTAGGQESQRVLEEALMLTRDENIVEVGLLVQYRVKDSADFVFNVKDPDNVLATTAEVALRSAVGQMPIDDVITERRADVQERTRVFLETLMDAYESGIQVTDVRLQVADAPDQVRDAFHEVVRAREDRERKVNEAQAYREDVLPRARGEAKQITEAAIAFQQERIRVARGDSTRFLSILKEYQSAPDVTRERLHLEALEKVLPQIDKILLDGGNQDQVLPFLPLRDVTSPATTAESGGRDGQAR
ncbi:MAG: FtsH protease activity modulator HflK [Chloroflexota bacterium]|jgi:membrane protease subunit HflK